MWSLKKHFILIGVIKFKDSIMNNLTLYNAFLIQINYCKLFTDLQEQEKQQQFVN